MSGVSAVYSLLSNFIKFNIFYAFTGRYFELILEVSMRVKKNRINSMSAKDRVQTTHPSVFGDLLISSVLKPSVQLDDCSNVQRLTLHHRS